MKIPSKYKPELCASRDTTRPQINGCQLIGNRIVATDGRRLVSIPVEIEEGDTDGKIPVNVLAAARSQAKRNKRKGDSGDASISANSKLKFQSEFGVIEVERESVNYPSIATVIPKQYGAHSISLNVELLYGVAKALGSDNLTIAFDGRDLPLIITGEQGEANAKFTQKAFAILMPVRTT